jgi:hypothetical protein
MCSWNVTDTELYPRNCLEAFIEAAEKVEKCQRDIPEGLKSLWKNSG